MQLKVDFTINNANIASMTAEIVAEEPAFETVLRINRGQREFYFHRSPDLHMGQSGHLAIDWTDGDLPRVDYYEAIPDSDFWGMVTVKSIGEAGSDWVEGKTMVPQSRPGSLPVTFKKLTSYKFNPETKALELRSRDRRGVGVIRIVAA